MLKGFFSVFRIPLPPEHGQIVRILTRNPTTAALEALSSPGEPGTPFHGDLPSPFQPFPPIGDPNPGLGDPKEVR